MSQFLYPRGIPSSLTFLNRPGRGLRLWVRVLRLLCVSLALAGPRLLAAESNLLPAPLALKVYIVPIQENIMPPLVYVVRRGVKEAMEAKADALILAVSREDAYPHSVPLDFFFLARLGRLPTR